MFKMNLLNAEEAGKVNGGAVNICSSRDWISPICKTIDVGTCFHDYFPGCGTRDLIVCGVRDLIIQPCKYGDIIRPCSKYELVIK